MEVTPAVLQLAVLLHLQAERGTTQEKKTAQMVSEAAAAEVFLVTRLDPVEEEPFCTVAFFLLPTSSGPHQMRSPWAAAHGREHGRCRPSTVCLFSAALC